MIKLAIIGASYLQEPLIEKAKSLGIQTHVFAWKCGDIGEKTADYFYPISIVEKEEILQKCREIAIDGICTIASDLAVITVNYVACKMGLPGNSMESTALSTNKHLMREAFEKNGDPSPKSMQVESIADLDGMQLHFPVIVKPTDRSGSRGITKLYSKEGLAEAIENAKAQGFEKKALVEEFAIGKEYSVEYISYQGEHHFLALTKKFTTGEPRFIETGHLEPAPVSDDVVEKVKSVVTHALDTLEIKNGASHSEIKIAEDGSIKIIEIGARMGGDCIGSHLVELSTGIDFIKCVIDIALSKAPDLKPIHGRGAAGIRYIFNKDDLTAYKQVEERNPEMIVVKDIHEITDAQVTDSASRLGMFLMKSDSVDDLIKYLPNDMED